MRQRFLILHRTSFKKIAVSFALVASLVTPVVADAWTGNVFKSPTGNLVCKYRSGLDSITCGRWNDERMVYMNTVSAAVEASRMNWSGESVHTLYYGETWRGNGSRITCFSGYNGVRCTNWRGHGFFINRDTLNRW
jgi:hypothetical protein